MALRAAYVAVRRASGGLQLGRVSDPDLQVLVCTAIVLGGEDPPETSWGTRKLIRGAGAAQAADPRWQRLIRAVLQAGAGQPSPDLRGALEAADGALVAATAAPQFAQLRSLLDLPPPPAVAPDASPQPAAPAAVVASSVPVALPSPAAAVQAAESAPVQRVRRNLASAPTTATLLPVAEPPQSIAAPSQGEQPAPIGVGPAPGPYEGWWGRGPLSQDEAPAPALPEGAINLGSADQAVDAAAVPDRQALRAALPAANAQATGAISTWQAAVNGTIPLASLSELIALIKPALQRQIDRDDEYAGAGTLTDKWGPQQRELSRLEAEAARGADTPQNRLAAQSLLTDLGGSEGVVRQENLRSDSGDSAARSRTLGQEVRDQAGLVINYITAPVKDPLADALSTLQDVAVGVGVGALALGVLWALTRRS